MIKWFFNVKILNKHKNFSTKYYNNKLSIDTKKNNKMTTCKSNINTRLVREIISENIPVSENIMNLYLIIEYIKLYCLP